MIKMNKPNIILIVVDTMRKDAISLYNQNVKTPNIELLAKDSTVFNNAISASPWTVPSHASIFTGKYPSEHNIHETKTLRDKDLMGKMNNVNYKTIAEILKNSGYNTIGLSANVNIVPGSGFDKGFNFFEYIKNNYKIIIEDVSNFNQNNNIINKFRDYLKDKKIDTINMFRLYKLSYNKFNGYPFDKGGYDITLKLKNISLEMPFFLFINFMEMHEPYLKNYRKEPDGLYNLINVNKNKKIDQIITKYYKQSEIIDNYIGYLVEWLKKNEIYDKTKIIFTSDHGQSINSQYYGHGIFLSDELIKVPLIIKNGDKQVNNNYISLTELYNIIINFSENIDNIKINNDVYSETFGLNTGNYESDKYNIRRLLYIKNNYKLIINENNIIETFQKNDKNLIINKNEEIINNMLNEMIIFNGNDNFIDLKKINFQ